MEAAILNVTSHIYEKPQSTTPKKGLKNLLAEFMRRQLYIIRRVVQVLVRF